MIGVCCINRIALSLAHITCIWQLYFKFFRTFADFLSNGIGVRPVGSNALWLAGEYIFKRMEDLGLNPEEQPFVYTDKDGLEYNLFNVVGEIKATEKEERVIVFCAHYDTVPTSKGGIDNTTGVALVMTLAKALTDILRGNGEKTETLKNLNKTTTYRFIALAGEEVGCVGSKAYLTRTTKEEKAKIFAALNFDMFISKLEDDSALVLNTMGGYENGEYVSGTDEKPFDNVISKAVVKGVNEYEKESGKSFEVWSPRNYGHSDHQSFHENNIESANVTIRGSRRVNGKLPDGYHSPKDVYDENLFKMDECEFFVECVLRAVFYI